MIMKGDMPMSIGINYAILGLLAQSPRSGYDLKKAFADSPFLFWSGNNNQIYKSLLELSGLGFAELSETVQQDGVPTKKVYAATDAGRAELRTLALGEPEIPEIRNPFLVQLAFSEGLRTTEMVSLLGRYRDACAGSLAIAKATMPKSGMPSKERDAVIAESITENVCRFYEREMEWASALLDSLAAFTDTDDDIGSCDGKDVCKMATYLVEAKPNSYISVKPNGWRIENSTDAGDIVSACFENDVNRALLPEGCLSEAFLTLSTGILGEAAQKFTNYNIKAAIVVDKARLAGRFGEYALETNKGDSIRVFTAQGEAEKWLAQ
jgi:DNA-binding PadR family transcriptional regulator